MHLHGPIAFACLIGAACSAERRGDGASAASDSLAHADWASLGAASPPVTMAPPSVTVMIPDPEVRAACTGTAAAWRKVGDATVRELDTLLTPRDIIQDHVLDTVQAPGMMGGRWPACGVEVFAAAGLDSVQLRALYWPAADWVVFPRLNADGPGSHVQVYQRGRIRCQVATEGDPGDDSDSTYVPSPYYREWTLCWRHGRLVSYADTVYLGG